MRMLIKIQARMRGFIARMKYQQITGYTNAGMGGGRRFQDAGQFDPTAIDYENVRV